MKTEKKAKNPHIIQSLDKGLYLLEVIEQIGKPVTLADLWAKMHWDKATLHRLLATLEGRGYIWRDKATKQYRLGLKIYGLYNSLKRNMDLQGITHPHLTELARLTGESAHLAVVVDKSIVFIDRVTSSEVLSVNTQIGAREPLYCTALGRAYLAFLGDPDLAGMYPEALQPYTDRTVTSFKEISRLLAETRACGYAVDDEEYIDGIRCVAAPILNEMSLPIAALGISGPKLRLRKEKVAEYGRMVREAAIEVSLHCGYQKEGMERNE